MVYPEQQSADTGRPMAASINIFWWEWNEECARRGVLHGQRGSWPEVIKSMSRVNAVLDRCPVPWARETPYMTQCGKPQMLETIGTLIYVAYHPKYGLRYWGQAGAKSEPRSGADRFKEEVRDAQQWY